MTQPEVILHYLKLSIIPYPQCFDYAWTPVVHWQQFLLPGITVGGLLFVVIVASLRLHPAGYCGIWILLTLAPTSSFIPITDCAAEHRMYLALAGVVALIVGAVYNLYSWSFERNKFGLFRSKPLVVFSFSAVLSALMFLTVLRNSLYSSPDKIWVDVISTRPDNSRAYLNLAIAFLENGELQKAEIVCSELLSRLSVFATMNTADIPADGYGASRLKVFVDARYYAHGCNVFGMVLAKTSRLPLAVEQFEEALRLFPNLDVAKSNLRITLVEMGKGIDVLD